MRKAQQDKILKLLRTLAKAHSELHKQASVPVLCGLLADMQDFALEIGRYIETVEGEGTNTVTLIGELCRSLYMAYCEKSVANYEEQLGTQISGIIDSVRSELKPGKIEAAFFPYKLSMADSLESIWQAAMEDPDCNVTICPIPYFDRLPNGLFGKMHDEGESYPKNLPIVNWQEYDVRAHHPDIIFIHSPYDEGNYVTSIHPDFYSKRLRECTDMLVYSPYYLVVGDVPEEQCTTAANIYADKVIMQSERVRSTYIRSFQTAFGTRFGNPVEKFIPLGSPKFDKVLNAKRDDYKLPKQWGEMIAGKKTVLYNTSLGVMLQNSEPYLAKMKDVMNLFRKRSDIVLWWRPHPLFEATLESMRPALAREYRRMVSQYQQEAYGIYDDTPDLHRSIAWCDAYYGDGSSSLLPLWFVTGKPLLIQNPHCLLDNGRDTTESLSETAFSPAARWKEFTESPNYPQYNLWNLQNVLVSDKRRPLDREALSLKYILPEGGAGKAIYQYIKNLVTGGNVND